MIAKFMFYIYLIFNLYLVFQLFDFDRVFPRDPTLILFFEYRYSLVYFTKVSIYVDYKRFT